MKNKRNFGRFVALMAAMVMTVSLLAGSFSLQVQAETTGKVTATSANVRKTADKNSDAVGGLLKNDTFSVQGKVTGNDGKVWYLITFGSGTQGYVRSDLVSVDGEVETVTNTTTNTTNTNTNTNTNTTVQTTGITRLNPVSGTVNGKTVNIRAGAGTTYSKVASVNKGTVLTITGQATGSDNKVWYQVTFISNNKEITGFIRHDYVDPAGDLTPYTEPNTQPEPDVPSTEPDEPSVPSTEPDEPAVSEPKDWETEQLDGKWMLVENSSGKYYGINDLIQISRENAEKLEAANKSLSGQKAAIVILVIVLVVVLLAVAFFVFRFKDLIMEEILGMKEESSPAGRPERRGNSMPQRARAGENRPVRPAQRPEGAPVRRPEGAPVRRPEGTPARRPEGAPARRPEGAPVRRPEGAPARRPEGAPVRRPEGAPAKRTEETPVKRPEGAPVKKTESLKTAEENKMPEFELPRIKEEQIQRETDKSLENKQMESKIALNDNAKKPKNFMADEDEFEFEFLNWDGDEDE